MKSEPTDASHKAIDSITDQVDQMSHSLCDEPASQTRRVEPPGDEKAENVIDWAQLIGRIVDEELIAEIMPICVEDNKKRLKMLAEAVEKSDSENVKSYAHAIKGSSANVGAKRLSELACRLEHSASQNDLSQAGELLQKITVEFQRFQAFVSKPDWIEIAKKQSG